MRIVRESLNGDLKDLYLIDDAGNKIRGIVSSDCSTIVELEVFEGNFELLLALMPSDEMLYFTKESIKELEDLIYRSRNVAERDALSFVEAGVDRILRNQLRPGNLLKISPAGQAG